MRCVPVMGFRRANQRLGRYAAPVPTPWRGAEHHYCATRALLSLSNGRQDIIKRSRCHLGTLCPLLTIRAL